MKVLLLREAGVLDLAHQGPIASQLSDNSPPFLYKTRYFCASPKMQQTAKYEVERRLGRFIRVNWARKFCPEVGFKYVCAGEVTDFQGPAINEEIGKV